MPYGSRVFASVTSAAVVGVDTRSVRVEVTVRGVNPAFTIVGLPDASVREARERVQSAVRSSGIRFPTNRVTVNLAPADLPKVGSAYDLPMALGVLAAAGEVPSGVADVVAIGELALDGTVRAARGGLAAGMIAAARGIRCLVAPSLAGEAALAGADVRGVRSLSHAIAVAVGEDEGVAPLTVPPDRVDDPGATDLATVRGQPTARRALEIAAAGGHHVILSGPPGTGKTLLARCLPSILPPLGRDEALDVACAHAAAGRPTTLGVQPPFRSPHHTATTAAILGGGSGIPVPGELTLADHGVLFLDELAEFPAHLLDTLRQPIEEGVVHIARKGISVAFPCRVQLVAATNPCPCGYFDDERVPCRCSPARLDRYQGRLSGPLLDRFDLRVPVRRVGAAELLGPEGEPSASVRARVVDARSVQRARQGTRLNRSLSRTELDGLSWDGESTSILATALDRLALTARGWDRVRRVARTIADLEGVETTTVDHMAEALALRGPG